MKNPSKIIISSVRIKFRCENGFISETQITKQPTDTSEIEPLIKAFCQIYRIVRVAGCAEHLMGELGKEMRKAELEEQSENAK